MTHSLIYARAQQAETQGSNLPKQPHYKPKIQTSPLQQGPTKVSIGFQLF
ncbi:hypothetical protein V6Z11_D11G111200 [Gossypium hirsutum]